ncbi:DUF4153 domain-containing protein [Harryflintia acetispora]|uniref:Uncharacterized protein DUF4173 n=1 Tax=Harryflintia acetispora TaxID=1849041 RepID=A0A9X8UJJ7_9FIRM|nr:DUF4173 domain-containing protein [Harryflintia acetispora]TCL43779.1 uncharacterized protein DUF4173 [Harryflintia acetispora]
MDQEKKLPQAQQPKEVGGLPPAAQGQKPPFPRNDYLSKEAPRTDADGADAKTAELRRRCSNERAMLCTLGSLLLGVIFCETMLFGGLGMSVPVFTLLCYLLVFWYLHREGEKAPRAVRWMMVPNCLLALSFLLHHNPSTMFLAVLTMLVLWAGQLLVLGKVPISSLFSFETVSQSCFWLIGKPVQHLFLPLYTLRKTQKHKSRRLAMALLGVLAALPVLAVLLILFALADPIFGEGLYAVQRAIGLRPVNLFGDLLFGTFLGLGLAALLLGLREEEKQPAKAKSLSVLDPVLVSSFLILLDLVVLSFVGVQLGYFFGGEERLNLDWLTYAEYARRGFFELAAASGIVFTVVLLALILCRRREGGIPRLVRALLAVLCLSDGVVLLSAVQRMLLYVRAYGLSLKRLLTLWFMLVVGVSLILLLVRCLYERFPAAKWVCVALIAGVCLLRCVNVERLVAHYNVERYLAPDSQVEVDCGYFSRLSYTAAPELQPLFDAGLDDGLYDVLVSWDLQLERSHPIYGFTLERPAAKRMLEQNWGLVEEYDWYGPKAEYWDDDWDE